MAWGLDPSLERIIDLEIAAQDQEEEETWQERPKEEEDCGARRDHSQMISITTGMQRVRQGGVVRPPYTLLAMYISYPFLREPAWTGGRLWQSLSARPRANPRPSACGCRAPRDWARPGGLLKAWAKSPRAQSVRSASKTLSGG